jgi:hypothetical protein
VQKKRYEGMRYARGNRSADEKISGKHKRETGLQERGKCERQVTGEKSAEKRKANKQNAGKRSAEKRRAEKTRAGKRKQESEEQESGAGKRNERNRSV